MSRLLVILFAAGIVILGLQPIEQNYGGFSGLLSSVSYELSDKFGGFSVENWAKSRESHHNDRSLQEYRVLPRKPLFERNRPESPTSDSKGSSSSNWLSRVLPTQERVIAAPEPRVVATEDLTVEDREQLDSLLGDL